MSGPFYIILQGGGNPKKAHGTIEEARVEAQRLVDLYQGSRWARILEVRETIEATTILFPGQKTAAVPRVKFKKRWNVEAGPTLGSS